MAEAARARVIPAPGGPGHGMPRGPLRPASGLRRRQARQELRAPAPAAVHLRIPGGVPDLPENAGRFPGLGPRVRVPADDPGPRSADVPPTEPRRVERARGRRPGSAVSGQARRRARRGPERAGRRPAPGAGARSGAGKIAGPSRASASCGYAESQFSRIFEPRTSLNS